jgi:hypothetical protein
MSGFIKENIERAKAAEELEQKLFELIKSIQPNLYSSPTALKAVKLLAFRFDLFRH